MDLTTWLAVLGFATGVVGLGWQISTHWLTGRRLQVLALRERSGEEWVVQTHIMNVGRLDVSVQSYSVWADFTGRRLQRFRWRLRAIRQLGWSHARRTQMTFSPSVTIGAPGGFADDAKRVQFPFILKAGEMYIFPKLNVHVPAATDRVLTSAVGLGVGRPLQARVVDVSALGSRAIEVPEESGWRMGLREVWVHPAFAPEEDPIVPGSRTLTELVAASTDLLEDLSRIRETPQTAVLREHVEETRTRILDRGRVSGLRLQQLQELLDEAEALTTFLSSAAHLKAAVDVAAALQSRQEGTRQVLSDET